MHEHTRRRTLWKWNPLKWLWGSYESPSTKYVIRFRGPLQLSTFTYWEHDHVEGEDFEGCGASWLIGTPGRDPETDA